MELHFTFLHFFQAVQSTTSCGQLLPIVKKSSRMLQVFQSADREEGAALRRENGLHGGFADDFDAEATNTSPVAVIICFNYRFSVNEKALLDEA